MVLVSGVHRIIDFIKANGMDDIVLTQVAKLIRTWINLDQVEELFARIMTVSI